MTAAWRIATGLAFGLWIAGLGSPAFAAVCDVNAQQVSFGNYDSIGGAAVDGVGSVNVACDSSVAFTVALTAGSGTFEDRRMAAGAEQLSYNLYTNSSRTAVWGDGISGSGVSASGTDAELTVFGRIGAGQNVPAGIYLDSVTVTVTY